MGQKLKIKFVAVETVTTSESATTENTTLYTVKLQEKFRHVQKTKEGESNHQSKQQVTGG